MLHRVKSTDRIANGAAPLSTEDYNRFKQSVTSGDVFKQPIKLSELEVQDTGEIRIHGKTLPMTGGAFTQLCQVLGINSAAEGSLVASIGAKPTAQIIDMMRRAQMSKKKNEIGITICKSLAQVTGFSRSAKQILPGSMFIDSLEGIMNNNPEMQIVGATHEENGKILVIARNPKWAFNVAGNDNESFHSGMAYSSDGDGVSIEQYLERLICMNGMALRGAEESLQCTSEKKIGPFLRAATTLRGFSTGQFALRAEAFMNLPASVREVKNSVQELKKQLGSGPESMDLIKAHIPFMELREDAHKALGMMNVYRMPAEFQAKMNANINYWELVNAITYIASHEVSDVNTRHSLMTHAGDMMIANPDTYMPVSQIYPTAGKA